SEEHTSELQSHLNLVCRLLLEKKKKIKHKKKVTQNHTLRKRKTTTHTSKTWTLMLTNLINRFPTCLCSHSLFFFFNDTAPTEIYPFSLHDALPIFQMARAIASSKKQPILASLRAAKRHETRSEEHTSELQSHLNLVCRLLLEK